MPLIDKSTRDSFVPDIAMTVVSQFRFDSVTGPLKGRGYRTELDPESYCGEGCLDPPGPPVSGSDIQVPRDEMQGPISTSLSQKLLPEHYATTVRELKRVRRPGYSLNQEYCGVDSEVATNHTTALLSENSKDGDGQISFQKFYDAAFTPFAKRTTQIHRSQREDKGETVFTVVWGTTPATLEDIISFEDTPTGYTQSDSGARHH
ncbi:uncharacterized protein IL334_004032 [Kwoniella shivajii]|uniref:EF-hand domain-containing protein n=1 Tax=Kwoniella shivajii TaxID=564305 RepID=A0ABZ1CZL9_9TREE|nr:hypothetical protein IL334_004032 [Kwoniella shivajii]